MPSYLLPGTACDETNIAQDQWIKDFPARRVIRRPRGSHVRLTQPH